MAERDFEKEEKFMDILLDENGKIRSNIIIKCSGHCESRDFKVTQIDGVTLECNECGNEISINFIKKD